MSSNDARQLRDAFGSFLSGVTVVTTLTSDGVPVGFTANSFASVSLEPPLLLVCYARSLNCFDVFNQCAQFSVSVLAEDQQDVSNIFASYEDDRFAQVEWYQDSKGNPVIGDAAATFACDTYARHEAGDHIILVGEVQEFSASRKQGLGYSAGSYFSLGLERQASELLTPTQSVKVGAIIEYEGRILMRNTAEGLEPPAVLATHQTGSLAAIRDHLASHGIDVAFGPVYSIFENAGSVHYSMYYRGRITRIDERNPYALLSSGELENTDYSGESVRNMMQRYLIERAQGVFNLHVDDKLKGGIPPFSDGE